jgi:hypothetical protein
MGNAIGVIQEVYQTITFPTNLIGATLSLANETLSTDPNGDDSFTIYLTTTNFGSAHQLGTTVYSENPTSGWVYASTNFITYAGSNLLSTYAGQTVDLLFYVQTDATYGYLTQFNIDDVSLVAGTTADIPSNDNFTNATLIPPDGITNVVTTTYASREAYEPDIAGNPGGHSVWWTWSAPAIGTVNISTTESDFYTFLGVYAGSSLSNLTVVTNYNGTRNSAGSAYATFKVAPGTQYQITVDGYSGEAGSTLFTFDFVQDTTPPVVKFTSPTTGADVTNSTVEMKGTASDSFGVTAVYYQLENASGATAWQLATGTTNWSATVTNLLPGTNTVRVAAYDTATNIVTNSCLLNYIVYDPLALTIVGKGTVAGATNGQLLHLDYPYSLTAKATTADGFGFKDWTGSISTNTATIKFNMTQGLSLTANFVDIEKPTLNITAPVKAERWSNSLFHVTGTAKDNVGVASISYQLNSNLWTELVTNVNTTNGWTNWNISLALAPGPNTIKAYSEDAAGNISITNSVSFIYVPSTNLTVQTNGPGKFTPDYNNVWLALGTNYSMTATAVKGYVFSNWTGSTGAVLTNGATLKFTMASNLSFTANFISNPFAFAGGTYQGLFYNTNDMTPGSSGFFSAQVSTNGSFTAKFQQGNHTFSFAGQFSLTGGWTTNALKAWDNTAIALQLNLNGEGVLQGGLTNSSWTAILGANLAASPAPQAGKKYTLILPGSSSTTQPGGNGFGRVSVSTIGNVTFSGTLGDGTAVTPSGLESAEGQWPLYASLDSGNGMVIGWLTFTNDNERGSDIEGLLNWIRPPQTSATLYKAGITNEFEVVGSAYSYAKSVPLLQLTNGYAFLEGGGLAESISNQFFLENTSIAKGSNKLSITFATSTGLFQGSTTNAAGKPVSFSGAVLQKQTNGFGQFINGDQSGSVFLAPQQDTPN